MSRTKSADQGTQIIVFVSPDDHSTSVAYRSECERRGAPFRYVDGGVGIQGTPPRVPPDTLPILVITITDLEETKRFCSAVHQLPFEMVATIGAGMVASRSGEAIGYDLSCAFDIAAKYGP